jgi:hypothetical protein
MESNFAAPPRFGGKLKTPDYYERIHAIVAPLRSTTSLRLIADALNAAGYRTPRDFPWDKQKLSMYIRNTSL